MTKRCQKCNFCPGGALKPLVGLTSLLLKQSVLEEEEMKIVSFTNNLVKVGFGLSYSELISLLQELCQKILRINKKRKFPKNWGPSLIAPKSWAVNFAARNGLKLKSTLELSRSR